MVLHLQPNTTTYNLRPTTYITLYYCITALQTYKVIMKLIIFGALSLANFAVAARLFGAQAEAFCGDLGVMPIPQGADPNTVRTCLEHPLHGLDLSAEMEADVQERSNEVARRRSDPMDSLEKRSCWYGKPVGCTRGYCWKSCGVPGTGLWCWTAKKDDGSGPWETCKGDGDCSGSMTCGGGGCKACGCSC